MKKLLFTALLFLLTLPSLTAQQQYHNWYISAGAGGMSYYGDLSYKLSAARVSLPAYQFSIGRNISSSLALTLQGTYGQISANDRAKDWKGRLQTGNMNFSRALNFQTDIRSANLLLSYRFNNGNALSKHAAIGPYVYAGIGITDFTVYGDLYDESGQRYYYWSDNTIRNQAEQTADPDAAQIIEQDGKFETNLSILAAEQAYPTTVWSIPAGLGVKMRISDRLSANLQAGASYAFSGFLDDVNGNYRDDFSDAAQAYASNPSGVLRNNRGNNKKDVYLTAFLSLGYHFNFKKKNFQAPMVYTGYTPAQELAYDNDAEQPEEPLPATAENQPANQAKIQTMPAVKTPVAPSAVLEEKPGIKTSRETVDINLRVIVEGGRATVDTVNIPLSQTKPALDISIDTVNRTSNLQAPSAAYQSNSTSSTRETLPLTKTRQVTPSGDNSLRREFEQMRMELDSLKAIQQAAITNKRNTDAVQADNKSEAVSGLQATTKEAENDRILALQQQVQDLKNDLERERRTTNNVRRQPPDVTVRDTSTRPGNSIKEVNTGSALSVPLVSERNYDKEDMTALRKEVSTIQSQLEKLRAQQQLEKDTLLDTRIDSLVTLISRIEKLDTIHTQGSVANPASPAAEDNKLTEQLIDSLKMQVTGLNQSLASMQAKFAEEMDSLSTGMPLSALGSTVIYYNVNASELESDDKQRLSVLGQKLKSNQSVLLNIKGFTDQTGNAAYNLALSRKRAENVKNYFVSQMGIDPDQILINYYGQQKASSGGKNPHDRRVEVELFRK